MTKLRFEKETTYCEEEQIAFVAKLWLECHRRSSSQRSPHQRLSLSDHWLRLAAEGILRGLRSGLLRPGSLTVIHAREALGRSACVPEVTIKRRELKKAHAFFAASAAETTMKQA
jgi:hypothetical protein